MLQNKIKIPHLIIKKVNKRILKRCLKIPVLQSGNAEKYAFELMDAFDREKSMDIDTEKEKRDSCFSTDYLFSEAGGQMFGILLCIKNNGEKKVLKAFSGQYNSRWTAPGWVPPIINPSEFEKTVKEKDKEIKKLDKEITNLESREKGFSGKVLDLKEKRKEISQSLMKELHSLYYLNNFKGEKQLMSDVFQRDRDKLPKEQQIPESDLKASGSEASAPAVPAGMPAGTGDCCAPKLLNYAAKEGLIPLSIIEFYYGKENKSGTRKHKHFYTPCSDKCEPIMGFLLSGIKELHIKYKDLISSVKL